jgi:hypothetical protein
MEEMTDGQRVILAGIRAELDLAEDGEPCGSIDMKASGAFLAALLKLIGPIFIAWLKGLVLEEEVLPPSQE